MKRNKAISLLIPLIFGIIFILPLISAATLNRPVSNGNYSTTMTVNVTVDSNVANNMTNTTCYYNSSGGTATTFLVEILNATAGDLDFTSTSVSISALSDATTYNISCRIFNRTTFNSSVSVSSVVIDNTNPTTSLTFDTDSISTSDSISIDWSSSDATSGLNTVTTTLTSPDTSRCPTKTYTSTTGDYGFYGEDTKCRGTYTVLVSAVDYAGNTGTSSKTFKASSSGLTKSGSNTLGGTSKSQFSQGQEINSKNLPLGETGTNIAILIILGAAIYLFIKRK